MKKISSHQLTSIALMTAVLCVLAPISVPVGISPVPVSLSTFGIFLSLVILDYRESFFSVLIYILLGLTGIPVFSGFTGGFSRLLGPSGGYISGYVLLALVAGFIIDRFKRRALTVYAGLIIGTVFCYFVGTIWLSYSMELSFREALFIGVIPFIPFDLIKAGASVAIGLPVRKALKKNSAVK